MVVAAAIGIGRVLGQKSRAVTWFLGGFGVAMIAAAVFPADPVDGFPPGTPEGIPTSISTTGLIHFVAGALGFVFLAISCFSAARAMSRRHVSPLARLSMFSGVAVVLGFFGGIALPLGVLGIWFAVVVGWAWLTVTSLRLKRLA
jgi:Na+-driven multidrug efflux pump